MTQADPNSAASEQDLAPHRPSGDEEITYYEGRPLLSPIRPRP